MRATPRALQRVQQRLARLRQPGHALPLRLWLILAVAAITGGGFLAQIGVTVVISVWDQQAADARLMNVRQTLGTDATQWRNPSWQRHAQSSLAELGVDAAVFAGQPGAAGVLGPPVYATAGARQFLDTGTVGSNAGIGGPSSGQRRSANQVSDQVPSSMAAGPIFQRIVLAASPHAAPSKAVRPPAGVAYLWYVQPPPGEPSGIVWPAVELGTFTLALAMVVWLVGQPVLRPLAEMSQAAEGIAGGDLDVHLSPSPVREITEVSGALEGMSGALRESLAGQAALDEQRRLFVSAIAHDLRTPLFMLRGYLKGLERGVAATPEKVAHYVGACSVQADALERLIADLFAYARLEYLEQEPERVALDLGDLLRQTITRAQPMATTKAIALLVAASTEPCLLLGDARLLARAVENLLDNALQYTPEGGLIQVSWGRQGDGLVFAIADSGPGIAAYDLPHLFTPLYRGEASRNRRSGGAGLGLAISQRILRAHCGDLSASNDPTGGAVFTGHLPAARRSADRPADLATVNTA